MICNDWIFVRLRDILLFTSQKRLTSMARLRKATRFKLEAVFASFLVLAFFSACKEDSAKSERRGQNVSSVTYLYTEVVSTVNANFVFVVVVPESDIDAPEVPFWISGETYRDDAFANFARSGVQYVEFRFSMATFYPEMGGAAR